MSSAGHEGKTYRLTGPEALNTADIAEQLSAIVGKPIRHIDLPEAAFREGMQAAGLPPPLIEMQMEYCAAVKEGRADIVTHETEQLLGRPPHSYAAWAHEHARAFL
jgi:uncharacterized protein YbjT (DUF2867 family)